MSPASAAALLLVAVVTLLAGCASEGADAAARDESKLATPDPSDDPEPSGEPTRYPIILVHGFNSSADSCGLDRMADTLANDGHVVRAAKLPPYSPPDVRARFLAEQVDAVLAESAAKKVNLIGHSQGGLDARYLASHAGLGYGDRVASVTTIATPHRGAWLADLALGVAGHVDARARDFFLSRWGADDGDDPRWSSDIDATLAGLTEAHAPDFNARIADDDRVFYQSWAGVSTALGLGHSPKDEEECEGKVYGDGRRKDHLAVSLLAVAPLAAHGGRANDGAVTVESAKWGAFRGCIPADHFDETGRHPGPDEKSGFDAARFYRDVAFALAAAGY